MPPVNATLEDRDVRQRDLVPPANLALCHALVVGVGAVGRQVALQLAALGVPAMDVVDHDVVSVENLAPQSYWPADLGRAKVDATAALCAQVNPDLRVAAHHDRFRRSTPRELPNFKCSDRQLVVFACVDSMTARSIIWESARECAVMFVDGRMSAEVIRVLAVGEPRVDQHYPSTLFDESRAYSGSCTAKSTVYTASIAAGLMLGQFTKWLRGLPLERDQLLNLLSAELTVS